MSNNSTAALLREIRELARRGYDTVKIEELLTYGGFPQASTATGQRLIATEVRAVADRARRGEKGGSR